MCDVNGLKEINDIFGHEGGDALIKACFKTLKDASRKSDIIVRLGGDEFIVLSPSTTLEDAEHLLTRIREVEKDAKVEVKDEKTGETSVRPAHMSIGAASTSNTPVEDVLKEADRLMYVDKEEYYKTHKKYR